MAAVLRVSCAHLEARQYAELVQALDLDASPPVGQLLHLASLAPSGGAEIVDLFQTPEAASSYVERRLLPALRYHGIRDVTFGVEQCLNVYTPDPDTLERLGAFAAPRPVAGASSRY